MYSFLAWLHYPYLVQKLECSKQTRPKIWLLMSWPLASTGHQQPYNWPCKINLPLTYTKFQAEELLAPVFQITASQSARSRQLWRRAWNFFKTFLQFYVYDLRFKAAGLTTFLVEFWTLLAPSLKNDKNYESIFVSCNKVGSQKKNDKNCENIFVSCNKVGSPKFNPKLVLTHMYYILSCSYWCTGAKAQGHQYPQCWLDIHCNGPIS